MAAYIAVRPGLGCLLLVTATLAAWALLWPAATPPLVLPHAGLGASGPLEMAPFRVKLPVDDHRSRQSSNAEYTLPQDWPSPPAWRPARVDPFQAGAVRNAPARPASTPLGVAPQTVSTEVAPFSPLAVLAPSVLPEPPALTYRYLGRFVGPRGREQVFLAQGERVIQVEVNSKLDDGYVVTAIDADAVRLHHARHDLRASIPLPGPPEESR